MVIRSHRQVHRCPSTATCQQFGCNEGSQTVTSKLYGLILSDSLRPPIMIWAAL